MAVKPVGAYDYDSMISPETSFVVVKDSKGRVVNPEVVSMTNQADTAACDLNLMFARFQKTGVLVDDVSGLVRTPVYGDFSDIGDFHAIKSRIAKAESDFMLFPADVRNRFDNDVQKLVEFLADPVNDYEAVKLGLKDRSVLAAREAAKEAAAAAAVEAAKAAAGAAGAGTGSAGAA